MDHIVLFGSTGMLGRYIYSYFIQRKYFRLTIVKDFRVNQESLESLDALLERYEVTKSTCIINCIGQIPQRSSEGSDRTYSLVNSLFPHRLWAACRQRGASMIQPATDCVYSGQKGSYIESDSPDERGAYGLSKSLGEPLGCTVLRTSIIGNELKNRVSLLEWVLSNKGKSINGYTNHLWNGITCLQYCKVIEVLLLEDRLWSGVRHITSPTPKSKYELACLIRDIYECPMTITPIATTQTVNKTLSSQYPPVMTIPELEFQIKELAHFTLLE
jgi:dTDP-4-dehydrorhamnose reductase